ncbi:AbrB/MazE/SpoVT family DNA-binding domain-containing protein [Paenibacillus macerans]|uniref:AbrB/MazE/SpoVT family DNA-binding domain-containing protein n=1 Tax=Paenibacillus macerans TaxID=44252 RepID=UPI00203EA132|nr:AbrB/MazE/SpoVT family DNA-binding domain-containing protein [Paenibacillus macerans]MCM3702548.1 AbrB/MazE/SpoVT family DNA-binding domain-containing protein [Paenibacillus macerans]
MIRSIGIVRPIDELGRIVIPIELRRFIGIGQGDTIEFFIDNEFQRIMMRPYRTQECLFCQSMEQLIYFRERFICAACLQELFSTQQAGSQQLGDSVVGAVRRPRQKTSELIRKLNEVMATYPSENQSKWAKRIGVSPSRVSQLLRAMKEAGSQQTANQEIAVALGNQSDSVAGAERRPQQKTSELIRKLNEVMATYPSENQSKWAERIGVSPSRVSQLLRAMK